MKMEQIKKDNVSQKLIAGLIRENEEAASITPPAKLNIISIKFLLTLLKKKTTEAPSIVINQVKIPAKKAAKIGFILPKKFIII